MLVNKLVGAHVHLVTPQAYQQHGFQVRAAHRRYHGLCTCALVHSAVVGAQCACGAVFQALVDSLVSKLQKQGRKPFGIPVRGTTCVCGTTGAAWS